MMCFPSHPHMGDRQTIRDTCICTLQCTHRQGQGARQSRKIEGDREGDRPTIRDTCICTVYTQKGIGSQIEQKDRGRQRRRQANNQRYMHLYSVHHRQGGQGARQSRKIEGDREGDRYRRKEKRKKVRECFKNQGCTDCL